jgi:hypothetical protein
MGYKEQKAIVKEGQIRIGFIGMLALWAKRIPIYQAA